jgi:DNA-binding CsgD family transcriptional regulator
MDESKMILHELRRLIRLVAVLGTEGKSQREQIRILASAGFPPKDISLFIGTTGNTVRVALAGLRKKGKSKRRRQR